MIEVVLVMYERHRVIALKDGLHSTHPPTHPYIRPCSLLWEFPRPIITGLSSVETRGCSVVRWDVLALGFYPKVSSQFDREKRPTGGGKPWKHPDQTSWTSLPLDTEQFNRSIPGALWDFRFFQPSLSFSPATLFPDANIVVKKKSNQ